VHFAAQNHKNPQIAIKNQKGKTKITIDTTVHRFKRGGDTHPESGKKTSGGSISNFYIQEGSWKKTGSETRRQSSERLSQRPSNGQQTRRTERWPENTDRGLAKRSEKANHKITSLRSGISLRAPVQKNHLTAKNYKQDTVQHSADRQRESNFSIKIRKHNRDQNHQKPEQVTS